MNVDKTRWERIDQLQHRTERTRIETRAAAAREIAAARFQFPSAKLPTCKTFVNLPEATATVKQGKEDLVPDIVVIDHPASGTPAARIAAIVADPEQITAAEAKEHWAKIASIPGITLFIYVPCGYADEAKRLCHAAHINPEGYRTWRNTPHGFEINDVGEAHSAVRGMLPKFARHALEAPEPEPWE